MTACARRCACCCGTAGSSRRGAASRRRSICVRAVDDGALATINAAVDVCNIVSLHSGLPISVVDLAKAKPPFRVAIAPAGSAYVFNASGQTNRSWRALVPVRRGGPVRQRRQGRPAHQDRCPDDANADRHLGHECSAGARRSGGDMVSAIASSARSGYNGRDRGIKLRRVHDGYRRACSNSSSRPNEFLMMPDDGVPRELVRGRIVTMNVPAPRHGYFCAAPRAFRRQFRRATRIWAGS